MVRIFPLIFVLLWSSAFITTKPIVDNSDPFSALAFRFFFVAIGFYLFCLYSKNKIVIKKNNLIESVFSGVLFHGFYLGGVFYSITLLSETWQFISKLNPVLYMVNAFRYGILGASDVDVFWAFLILCIFIIGLYISCIWLLRSGKGIRT